MYDASLMLVSTELRLMMRMKATFFWILLLPFAFLSMMMLSYGPQGAIGEISLRIDDRDDSTLSARYVEMMKDSLSGNDRVHFSLSRVGPDGAKLLPRNALYLLIPDGFERALRNGRRAQVDVRVGESNLNTQFALRALRSVTLRLNAEAAEVPMLAALNVDQSQTRSAPDFSLYMVTGVLVMSMMASAMASVCVALAERRDRNVFKLVACLPVSRGQYLAAMLLARIIVLIAASGLLLLAARLLFGVQLHVDAGRLLGTLVVVTLGAATLLALGVALSARLASVPDAMFVSNLVYLGLLFLSDLTMPMSAMPEAVRNVVQYLPTSEFVVALRAVLVNGDSLYAQAPRLGVMFAWLLVFCLVARLTFRWHKQ